MTTPVHRLGDLTDAVVATVRHTPARVALAWRSRRHRRRGLVAGVVVLLLYLVAIGDIAVSRARSDWPSVTVATDWVGKLAATRAPYLFEPVAVVRPAPWVVLFVGPGNLLLGGLLAGLVVLNVTVASQRASAARSCRATTFGRLLAVLPALSVGMACCAPTLLLAVGTSFAAALAPVFLPLRSWLFPVSVALLLATLLTARGGSTARPPSDSALPTS